MLPLTAASCLSFLQVNQSSHIGMISRRLEDFKKNQPEITACM